MQKRRRKQIVVSVDCEAYDEGVWWSFAFVVSWNVSSFQRIEFYADRSGKEIKSETIAKFWNTHERAKTHNIINSSGLDANDQELEICAFVECLKTRHPDFYLVSDNISFDIGMLDSILWKHGHTQVSKRSDKMYRQPIDIWCVMFGISNATSLSIPHIRLQMKRSYSEIYAAVTKGVMDCTHTSLFDACEVLALFLSISAWCNN